MDQGAQIVIDAGEDDMPAIDAEEVAAQAAAGRFPEDDTGKQHEHDTRGPAAEPETGGAKRIAGEAGLGPQAGYEIERMAQIPASGPKLIAGQWRRRAGEEGPIDQRNACQREHNQQREIDCEAADVHGNLPQLRGNMAWVRGK